MKEVLMSIKNQQLSIDECITIINENQRVKDYMIKLFGNKKYISYDDIETYSLNNEQLFTLIEAYCTMNNIEIIMRELCDNQIEDYDSARIFLNELSQYEVLSKDRERQLLMQYNNGDKKAKDLLIKHNLKLVVSIAKKYIGNELELTDLIQEGTFGLITSIEKFNVNTKYKLSTYAMWWIRQSIQRSIHDKGLIIKLPVHANEKILKIKKATQEFIRMHNRKPTDEELSGITGITVDVIKLMARADIQVTSLDLSLNEDEDTTLGDFIDDPNAINQLDYVTDNAVGEIMLKYMSHLTCRERDIICLRYGFIDGNPRTLDEVGKMYHVTRERIRQIESKAMRKLKNDFVKRESDVFSEYIEEERKRFERKNFKLKY